MLPGRTRIEQDLLGCQIDNADEAGLKCVEALCIPWESPAGKNKEVDFLNTVDMNITLTFIAGCSRNVIYGLLKSYAFP